MTIRDFALACSTYYIDYVKTIVLDVIDWNCLVSQVHVLFVNVLQVVDKFRQISSNGRGNFYCLAGDMTDATFYKRLIDVWRLID